LIYLDNAATTRVDEQVVQYMNRIMTENFYNPSALYLPAVNVSVMLNEARKNIANSIGAETDEIYFVSSGTEADNIALLRSRIKKNSRVIISETEHSAVYNSALELKQLGYDVVFAPVDRYGVVDINSFQKLLNDNTSLISIIHVNNETGSINNIDALSCTAKAFNKDILVHSDGVQAFGKMNINVRKLDIDMYSMSGHKIHAPKGVGALYIKKGVSVKPMLYGGGQEKNLRSSTENTSGIIGMSTAICSSTLNYTENENNMRKLLQYMAQFITKNIGNAIINTNINKAMPNIISIALRGIRGEVLMHSLEKHNIIIGIGSACSSKKLNNRIPNALGLSKEYRQGMIRISLDTDTSVEDIIYTCDKILIEYNNLAQYMR